MTLFDETTLNFEMSYSETLIRFALTTSFKDVQNFDAFTKQLILQNNSNTKQLILQNNYKKEDFDENFYIPTFLINLRTYFNVLNVLGRVSSNVIILKNVGEIF